MGGVLIGVSDDAKRMQAVPVDSASFETAKEELRAYIVDDKGKELDILNFIGRHGITPDDFKKLLDVVHQELLLKNEQDLLKNEEILKAWDKQEEEKNEKFWKEFFPLYIHDEKCPNCKSAQIKFMRDETHFWYEPCPNCGHVKKMRELKIRRLVVVQDGKLKGIITSNDIVDITPALIDVIAEKSQIEPVERVRESALLSGYCDRCGSWADELKAHDGQFLCDDCMADLEEPEEV